MASLVALQSNPTLLSDIPQGRFGSDRESVGSRPGACDYKNASCIKSTEATEISRTGQSERLNSFYMELMGDHLSSPPDKCNTVIAKLCSMNTTRLENKAEEHTQISAATRCEVNGLADNNFYTQLMGGNQIHRTDQKGRNGTSSPPMGEKIIDQPSECKDHTKLLASNEANAAKQKLAENSESPSPTAAFFNAVRCGSNLRQSYPINANTILQKNSPNTLRKSTEETSRSIQNTSGPNGKDNSLVNSRSSSVNDPDGMGDTVYLVRNLSVIMEEADDSGQEESFTHEQSWSQLLPEASSKTAHIKGGSQSPLAGVTGDDSAGSAAKVVSLSMPESQDAKETQRGFMVMPLHHLREQMTCKQTAQVGALMAIGFVFVAAILTWVFSPFIFGT